MNKTHKSEKIPKEMEALYNLIAELTDAYCHKNLNGDYAQLARSAIAALCCNDPSPVVKGHINTWACAIIYTLCSVNRLFEDDHALHINASDLCDYFDISANTAIGKSAMVAETLNIADNAPDWCLKQPELKPETKPVLKPETKSETRPEVKLEVKPDNKPVEITTGKKDSRKTKTKDGSARKTEVNVGDSVKVRKGVVDPDFADSPIEGWCGRVIAFADETAGEVDENNPLVDVQWDSFTLRAMTDDYIDRCEEEGLDCLSMYLRISDIEKVKPRDTMDNVREAQEEIHRYLDDSIAINESNEHDKRIRQILGNKDISVSEETLTCYLDYLEKNIAPPFQLTGADPFDWENSYLFGIGKKREYDKFKKTRPSYKDTFKFIKIEKELNIEDGILVKVQRLADNKKFVLPLSMLRADSDKSANYQLIHDYCTWFVNN
ncbi:MAG: hypothetical protein HQL05_09195 [Nitrospirae bacterium]|uniref:DUF6398 domain-containing protein n=1 Tax=Candidatus Magnetobacterium casense TaxID=1455061 RepID=UPI000696AAC2|nr:DUF6398 domain-containing protein [Candidatus Magnetobacterium casensis]MBF0337997.1 hypothetical protein [Nitrospirota bacterium]